MKRSWTEAMSYCLRVAVLMTAGRGLATGVAPVFVYNHFNESASGNRTFTANIEPGQYIEIQIDDLDSLYAVSWEPSKAPPRALPPIDFHQDSTDVDPIPNVKEALLLAQLTRLGRKDPVVQDIPHRSGVAGYIVRIDGPNRWLYREREGKPLDKSADTQCSEWVKQMSQDPKKYTPEWLRGKLSDLVEVRNVKPVVLVINVPERRGWQLELAGGFVGSKLRDERYAAVPESVGATTRILRRERDREDKGSVGVAAFIHVYKEEWGYLCPSLGVGISDGSGLALFPGVSWRWGGIGALTVGLGYGHVATRPRGITSGEVVEDTNALNDPPRRGAIALFAAFSYAFLSPGEASLKGHFETVTPKTVEPPKKDGEGK